MRADRSFPTPCTPCSPQTLARSSEFGWTDQEQGNVKASFAGGYLLLQIVGGVIGDKYGNKMFQTFKKAVAGRLTHGKFSWDFETGSNGMGFRRKILSRGYAAGTKGRAKSKMAALEATVGLLAAKNRSLVAENTSLRAGLLAPSA